MMDYYNRDGTPVATREEVLINWAKQYEGDDDSRRRVGSDTIGHLWVSTVFLGLDHSFGGGPPLIFETMVFDQNPGNDNSDLMCERYSTEEEALAGHEATVKAIREGTFTDYSGEVVDSAFTIEEEPTLI